MKEALIRPALPDDAEALLAVYAPYVEHTAVTFEYTVPTPEEFRARIASIRGKYPYFCLETETGVAGYAYAAAFRSRAAYGWSAETSIYLAPEVRGRGYGRRLYDALEAACRAMGLQSLYACITVPRGEDPYVTEGSVLFHRRMGWEEVGRLPQCGFKFGRWYDTVYMYKSVGGHGAAPAPVIPWMPEE